MVFTLLSLQFVAFPEQKNSIFKNPQNKNQISVTPSGSLGFYYNGKCHITSPNSTLISSEDDEWCSNVGSPNSKPFIIYEVKHSQMLISGLNVRSGCCSHNHRYCCCAENGEIIDDHYYCCCRLHSYSLHGSNDMKTWKEIYQIQKKDNFYLCKNEFYEFPRSEPYRFIKFQMDKEFPDCPFCMTINEIDLIGETIKSNPIFLDEEGEEESISIIGKIRKE